MYHHNENVRYISRDDWNSPINIFYNKIDLYSTQHTLIDDICVATSIREICESRDTQTSLTEMNHVN